MRRVQPADFALHNIIIVIIIIIIIIMQLYVVKHIESNPIQ